MNDHEKLIEDARAFADNGNGLNWQGRIRELADALEWANKRAETEHYAKNRARNQRFEALEALAAFEKAHTPTTPTDDEWQSLWDIIASIRDAYRRHADDADSAEVVDAILAAGFRRTEVPEPSADHEGHEFCDRRLGCVPLLQGEPSDAQVLAAARAYAEDGMTPEEWAWAQTQGDVFQPYLDGMRLALRAAAETGAER